MIELCQRPYIHNSFDKLNMNDVKKGFGPMSYDFSLGKKQCQMIYIKLKRMIWILCAFSIESFMYGMYLTLMLWVWWEETSCAFILSIGRLMRISCNTLIGLKDKFLGW